MCLKTIILNNAVLEFLPESCLIWAVDNNILPFKSPKHRCVRVT